MYYIISWTSIYIYWNRSNFDNNKHFYANVDFNISNWSNKIALWL